MKSLKHLLALALFLATLIHAKAADTPERVTLTATAAGATPFICDLSLTASKLSALKTITFTIKPMTGSTTRPLSAVYTMDYLNQRGYVDTATGAITVPVFGLYAGYNNTVNMVYTLTNGNALKATVMIQTAAWNDPSNGQVYLNPTVVQALAPHTSLSYSFILLKSFAASNTPILIDTDCRVRWVGTAGTATQAAMLYENGLYISGGTNIVREEFDGTYEVVQNYADIGVTSTGHHNIDPGKYGMILDVNTTGDTECVNYEIDGAGNLLNVWNLAEIIESAMIAGGDDPSNFVRPTDDWFHNNACCYSPDGDSMIISSRENFVICVDYNTKAIKWILGDPTKAWYTYPSLRKYALKVTASNAANAVPPIGQHAVSISGSNLLLFDDGQNSFNQTPAGVTLTYSAPRKYALDPANHKATEIWQYDNGQSIFSSITSSVYEDAPNNYLIDYSDASGGNVNEFVGLDSTGAKVFDYQYLHSTSYEYSWNAVPIHLEHLVFK